MQIRCTIKGYVGLLVGLAGVFYLIAGSADTSAIGHADGQPPVFAPSEKIDVEQAVSYPYDI